MSAGCVQVITLSLIVWIDYEKWTGNGLRKLWRCQPTHTKPLGSDEVGPSERCPGYVICDNRLERLAVAIVAMDP
jgi:hypothetical protein